MIKVLVVDDSNLILKVVGALIDQSLLEVELEMAHSGEEAIGLLAEHFYDILILDIVMPGKSGYDVLEFLRESGQIKAMKVMMITSNTNVMDLKKCFQLGASDFIEKPINEIEFIARLTAAYEEQTLKKSYQSTIDLLKSKNEELAQTQQLLLEAQNQLVQSEQLSGIGYLAAGVAHEINNPLGFIKNNIHVMAKYIEVLLEYGEAYALILAGGNRQHEAFGKLPLKGYSLGYIKEDLGPLTDETLGGIQRIEAIINHLRSFSGIDQLDDVTTINMNDNLQGLIGLLGSELFGSIEFQSELGLKTPLKLPVGHFNVALISILRNAIESLNQTPKENKCISIRTWQHEGWAFIAIRDNGRGVAPELVNKIFQPFFTTKDIGEGAGLGLTNARNIVVNQLKGKLDFDSVHGEYAEVTIRLPLSET